jgi:hypothetical protein
MRQSRPQHQRAAEYDDERGFLALFVGNTPKAYGIIRLIVTHGYPTTGLPQNNQVAIYQATTCDCYKRDCKPRMIFIHGCCIGAGLCAHAAKHGFGYSDIGRSSKPHRYDWRTHIAY